MEHSHDDLSWIQLFVYSVVYNYFWFSWPHPWVASGSTAPISVCLLASIASPSTPWIKKGSGQKWRGNVEKRLLIQKCWEWEVDTSSDKKVSSEQATSGSRSLGPALTMPSFLSMKRWWAWSHWTTGHVALPPISHCFFKNQNEGRTSCLTEFHLTTFVLFLHNKHAQEENNWGRQRLCGKTASMERVKHCVAHLPVLHSRLYLLWKKGLGKFT